MKLAPTSATQAALFAYAPQTAEHDFPARERRELEACLVNMLSCTLQAVGVDTSGLSDEEVLYLWTCMRSHGMVP